MSRYIDADKLIAEIERLAKSYQDPTFITVRGNTANNFRDNLLSFITSLQQEQPSLPSNLDEAAKEYMRNYIPFDQCDSRDIIRTFKAGAEWMAGRGVNLSHLIAWYIQSVDAHEPVWTKEHLEELVKDYILIPKN